eukprot:2850316-Amphidinium_carterae.1
MEIPHQKRSSVLISSCSQNSLKLVRALVSTLDGLVNELKAHLQKPHELQNVSLREPLMASCYKTGARFSNPKRQTRRQRGLKPSLFTAVVWTQ